MKLPVTAAIDWPKSVPVGAPAPGLGIKSPYQALNLRVLQGKTIDEFDPFTPR
jgi:hypothetical protein